MLRRMKRIAKLLALLGATGVIVWAMRDRFISVAISREPEPPAFRSEPVTAEPVDVIDGIGSVYAERLTKAGLGDVRSLAKASPDRVAEAASVGVGRARGWIDSAKTR